jgi:hypothetical protein
MEEMVSSCYQLFVNVLSIAIGCVFTAFGVRFFLLLFDKVAEYLFMDSLDVLG